MSHYYWEVVWQVVTLWLYGVKYWLPLSAVLGVAAGIHTTVHVIRSEEAKWLRRNRWLTAVASALVFIVSYAAWPIWLFCELLIRARKRGAAPENQTYHPNSTSNSASTTSISS